VLIYP
jgi:hypothetical protein